MYFISVTLEKGKKKTLSQEEMGFSKREYKEVLTRVKNDR